MTAPAPSAVPAAAPVRVRDKLAARADGPLPVVHRGPHALYLDLDGWSLGVLASMATAVPCALRLATPGLGWLASASAAVRDGMLHLDGHPLRIGRIIDTAVPRITAPITDPPPPPADLVSSRLGRGDGLTPYGDDVLCGWLAVHRAAGVATDAVDAEVRANLGRTTMLSGTLLDCAMHGEVIPEFAAYVASLDTPAAAARIALAKVGHSSGRGLLAGARLALHRLGHEGTTAA
ncbi:MAG: DUF2877 domain-containing protein [Nocardioides sp.]